jgi:hypothetical protein
VANRWNVSDLYHKRVALAGELANQGKRVRPIAQLRTDAANCESGQIQVYDGPCDDMEVTKDWVARKTAQGDGLEKVVCDRNAKKNA